VRATKQPLLLIRAKGAHTDVRERGVLHKVFVPLDGSRESEAIIPYVEELAARFKAKVILFRVVVPNYYFEYTEEEIIQLQPSIASTKDYLDKVSARLKHRGLTVKPEISIAAMVGAAAEQDNKIAVEIIKFAEELNTDVVAMSTYGQSGISRWAFGSITDKVLHAGTTPLLLVRIPGARKE
jgi:nucleotide-binding universal stress UspA family protein